MAMGERDNDWDAYIFRRVSNADRIPDWTAERPPGLRFAAQLLTGSFRSIEVWSAETYEELIGRLEDLFQDGDSTYRDDDLSLTIFRNREGWEDYQGPDDDQDEGSEGHGGKEQISGAQMAPYPKVHWARVRLFEAYIRFKPAAGYLEEVWNALLPTYGACFMGADETDGDWRILANIGTDEGPDVLADCIRLTASIRHVRDYTVSSSRPTEGTHLWVPHEEA
jgi:hypothetical protein